MAFVDVEYGIGGGTNPTLLYTINSDDSQNYNGGTYQIPNLKDYDYFFIVYSYEKNRLLEVGKIVSDIHSTDDTTSNNIFTSYGKGDYHCERTFTISGNSLTIGNLGYVQLFNSASSTRLFSGNQYCIPLRIYGMNEFE